LKQLRKALTFNIPARMDLLNITPQVEAALEESGDRKSVV